MNSHASVLEEMAGNRHGGVTQLFFAPSAPLRGAISHYTVQLPCPEDRMGGHDQGRPLTIVPDASGCLVITVKSDTVERIFWGPNSEAQQVTRDFNAITLRLLVEFLPGGAFGLFGGLPLHELHNSQGFLDSITPSLDRLFLDMTEKHQTSYPALLRAVDTALARRLCAVTENPLLRQVLTHASSISGRSRLNALVNMTSYSARHINRVCQERIGVSYTSFGRILRINEACRRINRRVADLRTLAHDLDYHDQAHFTKDFKSLCGVTPSEYQRSLSDFYSEETKLCDTLPGRFVPHAVE